MLTELDWILLSRNGYELFATLKVLETRSDLPTAASEIGPPHAATADLCRRCWIYPGTSYYRSTPYCPFCLDILRSSRAYGYHARSAVAIWGNVDPLPKHLVERSDLYAKPSTGSYIHDDHHFLLLLHRKKLKAWVEDILLYHPDITGYVTIFPPRSNSLIQINDTITRVIYATPNYHDNQLWVRFYDNVFQLFQSNRLKRKPAPIYDIGTFKSLLEAAAVFRSILKPEAQQALHEILTLENDSEERFYWGRLLNLLQPEAVAMLEAWRIRQWPKSQLKAFFDLMKYVEYYSTDSDDSLPDRSANQ